jgi:hypothetical protein
VSFCTGLAILGLCFPLPGATKQQLIEAGWFLQSDGSGGWFAGRSFRSEMYRVNISLTGAAVLETLVVAEVDRDEPSKIEEIVEASCKKKSGTQPTSVRVCRFLKEKFYVSKCLGGWSFKKRPMAAVEEASCKKYEPIFDEMRKDKQDGGAIQH